MPASLAILHFEDLTEAEQKAERDRISEMLAQDWDAFFAKDMATDALHEHGWTDVRIWFSLGYCQGDGAHFTGNILVKDAARLVGMAYPEDLGEETLTVRDSHSRYTHAHVVRVEISDTCDDDIFFALEPLAEALEEWRVCRCQSIFATLETDYQESQGEDAINAWLDCACPQYVRTLRDSIIRVD